MRCDYWICLPWEKFCFFRFSLFLSFIAKCGNNLSSGPRGSCSIACSLYRTLETWRNMHEEELLFDCLIFVHTSHSLILFTVSNYRWLSQFSLFILIRQQQSLALVLVQRTVQFGNSRLWNGKEVCSVQLRSIRIDILGHREVGLFYYIQKFVMHADVMSLIDDMTKIKLATYVTRHWIEPSSRELLIINDWTIHWMYLVSIARELIVEWRWSDLKYRSHDQFLFIIDWKERVDFFRNRFNQSIVERYERCACCWWCYINSGTC